MDNRLSKAEARQLAKRGVFIYGFGSALAGGIVAYLAADTTTAILIFIALVCATLSALALCLRFADWYADWYSDLMNRSRGRSK